MGALDCFIVLENSLAGHLVKVVVGVGLPCLVPQLSKKSLSLPTPEIAEDELRRSLFLELLPPRSCEQRPQLVRSEGSDDLSCCILLLFAHHVNHIVR